MPRTKHDTAADWAENDMELPQPSTTTRRGKAAADHGSDVLKRATRGRPPVDPENRLSETQQVRLTPGEKQALADLAEARGTRPAALARDAIRDLLARENDDPTAVPVEQLQKIRQAIREAGLDQRLLIVSTNQ